MRFTIAMLIIGGGLLTISIAEAQQPGRPHANKAQGGEGGDAMAKTPTGSRTGKVAGPSRSRLLRVSRSADEYPCTQHVPSPRLGPMATLAQAAKPTGPDHLGTDSEVGGRLPPETPHPSSLASRAVRRQSPEVGAECLNGARSDLCGGHSVMSVPTAII